MTRKRPLDEKFLAALFAEDELGVVIRAHIHVEARVNELVQLKIPFPDQLPRLRYEQTLRLACALGLREDAVPPLKALGDIRNRFGHRLDTRLTDGVVQELYDSFSPSDKQTILEAHALTQQQLAMLPTTPFDQLSARDRFRLIAVCLEALIGQACAEVEDARRTADA